MAKASIYAIQFSTLFVIIFSVGVFCGIWTQLVFPEIGELFYVVFQQFVSILNQLVNP